MIDKLKNPFITNGYAGSEYFCDRYRLRSASSVSSAIKGLLDKEFITLDRNVYSVYDKFFVLWLKMKGMIQTKRISQIKIKGIRTSTLKKCQHDLTDLADLRIIY